MNQKKTTFLLLLLVISISTIAQIERADSTINKLEGGINQKVVNIYDMHENKTNSVVSQFEPLENRWIYQYKMNTTYDNKNHTTMEMQHIWNDSTKEWIGNFRREYVLNQFGNRIIEIIYIWNNKKKSFQENEKRELLLDEKNNSRCEVSYNWNIHKNKWQGIHKGCIINNYIDNVTYYTSYTFDSLQTLIPNQKTETRSNKNGKPTFEEAFSWNSDLNKWVGIQKLVSEYDSLDRETLKFYYNWNENGEFLIRAKDETKYDSLGNVTLKSESAWNKELNTWFGISKQEFTFNIDGKILTESLSNFLDNQWIIDSRKEYYYNVKGRKDMYIGYQNYLRIKDFETAPNTITNQKMILLDDGSYTPITEVTEKYNQKDNYLVKVDKTVKYYNKKGQETGWIEFKWDNSKNKWVKNCQRKFKR
jgi:hypothetical protein